MNIDTVVVAEDFPLKVGDTLLITDAGTQFEVTVERIYSGGGKTKSAKVSTRQMFKPRKLTKWGPKPRKV